MKGENEPNKVTGDKQRSEVQGIEGPELGDEEERC